MTRQEYLDYLVSPQWQSLRIEKTETRTTAAMIAMRRKYGYRGKRRGR